MVVGGGLGAVMGPRPGGPRPTGGLGGPRAGGGGGGSFGAFDLTLVLLALTLVEATAATLAMGSLPLKLRILAVACTALL